MASKTTTTKPAITKPEVDLHAMLVAALKTRGIEPELRWSPTGAYASYRVEGKTIGYVTKQTKSGIGVQAGVKIAELPAAQRSAWKSREAKSSVFATAGTFGDAKGIERAAIALALAAEKQATARAAKTTPVEKPKTTRKRAPKAETPVDEAPEGEIVA